MGILIGKDWKTQMNINWRSEHESQGATTW
jgi:hypothetical protein